MADMPHVKLNDGNTIPQFGLGAYLLPPEDTVEIVQKALEMGYRHIDTAEMYRNEAQVGEAIATSGINRSEIFVTSKLNNQFHAPDDARKAFAETLEKLRSDYVDLFLIHWPLPNRPDTDYVETWKVLEEFKKDGSAKSIGVSNFQVPHLERLAAECETEPAVNQIELHPFFQNKEVETYNRQHGIVTEAWSPIARGQILDDPAIIDVANAHSKSVPQVVLRWHIQHGFVVFPKSSSVEHLADNFDVFDFELSSEEMAAIDALDQGESGRIGPHPETMN